jgi:YD repeat-containing protein
MASETDTYPNTGSVKTNYTYVGVSGTLAYLQEKDEYDFGQSSPFETTKYSYSSFTGPSFLTDTSGVTVGVPSQVIASSGGTTLAETDATYDGATPSGVSNLPQGTHDTAYEGTSPFLSRGNPTKVVRCTSGTGSSCAGPTTTYTYDVTGQVTSKTDPCGNSSCSDMSASNFKTTYSYSDNFTGGGSPSGNTNAYLTNMTYPTVNGAALQENFTYNYTTGDLLTDKDENGQTTTYTYADPLNRLTEIQGPPDPNNGNQQPTTSRSYNDTAPSPSVTVTVLQSPDPAISRVEVRDGMGHAVQSQLTSDPAGTVYVDTTYDGEGGVFQKSNPTRCSSSPGSMPSSCSESTWGVTSYFYDALGRVVAQKEPDGSALTWCYNDTVSSMPSGVTATCNSHIGSSSVDTWVDSTDENGNDSQRTTNAFGNLIEVMEPDGSTKNPPAMETDYTYDALSNLLSVKQWGGASGSSGARTRSFSYDSLSQLVQGFNPESGWTCYGTTGGAVPNGSNCTEGYDGNGNLASKTVGQGAPANAIGVTTSYVYDSLNRLTSKSYSSNDASRTPISCYQYDLSSVTNGAGRLANEWTQSYSSSPCNASLLTNGGYLTLKSILAYDSMGRPTSAQQQQCTPGKCAAPTPYAMTFGYDLAGNPKTLINSVGANNAPLTLTAGFDGAAHMNGVTSSWTSYPTNIYTLNNYGPVGPLNWSLGPTSPSPTLTISQGYTNRLWVNSISATGQVP